MARNRIGDIDISTNNLDHRVMKKYLLFKGTNGNVKYKEKSGNAHPFSKFFQ
jgi:hypothetical protein